jgi:hypothetical protein
MIDVSYNGEKEKMTVYISGAVTGKSNNNRRAFQSAYGAILELKYRYPGLRNMRVINPLHVAACLEKFFAVCGKETPVWEDYMRACIKKLCDADYIYFLKDWAESEGATVERYIAKRA